MIVTIVHVYVKPTFRDAFIKETMSNHLASSQEPGNLRFDFLQDDKDPNKFVLYEAYETEEDVAAHKKTSHYLHWRATVEDWMAQQREGIRHQVIAPDKKALWRI
jgi:autoinducer 2-degrading protein